MLSGMTVQIITETVKRNSSSLVMLVIRVMRNTENYGADDGQRREKVSVYKCHGRKGMYLGQLSHEDAYDSDVDEGPHAAVAFMANLSFTSGTNGATTSQVNEVHTDANQIFDNVNHLLTYEMHQEEHLDSDVESDIDDNTILYHQYQLDSDVQDVPTELSPVPPDEISVITILDDLRTQLDVHLKVNQEQSLVNDSLKSLRLASANRNV
ncbi:hypothetical protein Tco_0509586 [Tanacetum coccineum]